MNYRIQFFNKSVQSEIERWPLGIRASFVRITEQIVISGPNLGMPYTRPFGKGLFEIRARGAEGIGRHFSAASLIDRLSFCTLSSKRLRKHPRKSWKSPENGRKWYKHDY